MKTKNILLLSFASLSLLLSACAKQRPIDKVRDADNETLSKQTFTGQGKDAKLWFMKVTATRQTANGGFVFPGLQSEARLGSFRFVKDALRFENALSTYSKKKNAQTDRELLEEWSIKNTDTRLAESDGKVTNKEVEDDTRSSDKKRFFTIDWASTKLAELSTFPYTYELAVLGACWSKRSAALEENSREITEDNINFTIRVDYIQNPICTVMLGDVRRAFREDFTYTVSYKYSFARYKPSDYKPLVYKGEFDPIRQKYGFFDTVLETYHSDLNKLETAEQTQLKLLMNRWKTGDPKKPIVHHVFFARDAAEEHKWTFSDAKVGVIARVNELLERNNIGMRFAIHNSDWCDAKSTDVNLRCIKDGKHPREFGDIRYSFVQILDEDALETPLGYGPSSVNPMTGEVISANTTLYFGYLKYMVHRMKTARDRDPVKFAESSLYGEMKKALAVGTKGFNTQKLEDWSMPMETNDPLLPGYDMLLSKLLYGNPAWYRFTGSAVTANATYRPAKSTATDYLSWMNRTQATQARESLETSQKIMKELDEIQKKSVSHPRNSTLHFVGPALADARHMIIEGKTAEEVIRHVTYNVALHEFGHNLGLRHNFFGSVDKKNWGPKMKVTHTDAEGKKYEAEAQQKSSTVMEYVHGRDWSALEFGFGKYDEAALTYAYTNGQVDLAEKNKTTYLYCTDEHRSLNAMCNAHDQGTTPSEVVRSLIETYEDAYQIRNLRFGRAYWDTSEYLRTVYTAMFQIKKFLAMKQQSFNEDNLRKELTAMGKDKDTVDEQTFKLTEHLNRALILSVAFYQSVIQQQDSDRPYDSRYEDFTGALDRIGILYDKVFAMYFAMDDNLVLNNPNAGENYTSYLTETLVNPALAPIMQKFSENALTIRVDMKPWFIGFARALYAMNATNFENNYRDSSVIDRIGVACYSAATFQDNFGLSTVGIDHQRAIVNKSKNDYFVPGDEISIVKYGGKFYVSSKKKNPYAFSIIANAITTRSFDSGINHLKQDVIELFNLYRQARGLPAQCDD